jgi:putative restriction endonuclease
MNIILNSRAALKLNHYIRKADPEQKYWFDFSESTLLKYIEKKNSEFCLIIFGDKDKESDYYSIPFGCVEHIFTKPFMSKDKDPARKRWVGTISNHKLHITNYPEVLDIKKYYGFPPEEAVTDHTGKTRKSSIKQRVDQAVFRNSVLENFQSKCALTDIEEEDMLIASHIVPWSHDEETRLDPANGILLSKGIDALFDSGYITFDDELFVIVTKEKISNPLREQLNLIENSKLQKPKIPIKEKYLKYHRDNIFRK